MKVTRKELDQKIKDAVAESTSIPRPCILCGHSTMIRGLFVPDDPQEFGAPDGMEGFCIYPICSECTKLPKDATLAKIERILSSGMKALTAGLN